MKIEVGDTVELNNGEVHGVSRMIGDDPDHENDLGYGPFVIDGTKYHQDGRFADCGYSDTLYVKRIISRATDDTQSSQEGEPKLWREMTDAEKGALLLAHHEGKVIERRYFCGWRQVLHNFWHDDIAYRVKPKPVREVVTFYTSEGEGWSAFSEYTPFDTHRITFETVDGKPDCSTIKMEKL